MYRNIWKKAFGAVCSLNFYGSSTSNLLGITGFRSGNQILTDDIIYSIRDARNVIIRFYEEDGLTISRSIEFSYYDFLARLPLPEVNDGAGFAMVPFTESELSGVPSLELCRSCTASIGLQAAIIGYQFEFANLSLKPAIISAFYRNEKGVSFIQYDGTIKGGNSGAPLIDTETGGVIGMVASREMNSTKRYLALMKSIGQNIESLKAAEGKLHFDNIDPIQVLLVNQHQIKHLGKEIYRNGSGRIGFALEISHIHEYLGAGQDLDYDSRITTD
jgi:hypothetical protein